MSYSIEFLYEKEMTNGDLHLEIDSNYRITMLIILAVIKRLAQDNYHFWFEWILEVSDLMP